MYGSQALETIVGLAFFLGIVALTASGLTETISRVLKRRARLLRTTIEGLLETVEQAGPTAFRESPAYRAAQAGLPKTVLRGDREPDYLDASTFVAGVRQTGGGLGADVLHRSYESAVQQARYTYKRWATLVLFLVSLSLCAVGNLSLIALADGLWNDDAARAALVTDVINGTDPAPIPLDYTPGGCGDKDEADGVLPASLSAGWHCSPLDQVDSVGAGALLVVGWLLTALLPSPGAQFWFDTACRSGQPTTAWRPAREEDTMNGVDSPGSSPAEGAAGTARPSPLPCGEG